MKCDGCGSTTAARVRIGYHKGVKWEHCDICGDARSSGVPDVYIGSKGGIQTCENICDPKTGQPVPFSSKREKKAIMDRLKLAQHPSAERQHGSRNDKYLTKRVYG